MPEGIFRQATGDASWYGAGSTDPVRKNAPFTPVTIVNPVRPSVPILGVVILAGIALWFEFMRRKRGK